MRYVFAIIFPPVAVILCGKPVQFILNCVLTLCGWVPGVIHAFAIVAESNADKRNKNLIRAVRH